MYSRGKTLKPKERKRLKAMLDLEIYEEEFEARQECVAEWWDE